MGSGELEAFEAGPETGWQCDEALDEGKLNYEHAANLADGADQVSVSRSECP